MPIPDCFQILIVKWLVVLHFDVLDVIESWNYKTELLKGRTAVDVGLIHGLKCVSRQSIL